MAKRQPQEWPRDIEYIPIFDPDMARMVKALQILLDYNPEEKTKTINQKNTTKDICFLSVGDRG